MATTRQVVMGLVDIVRRLEAGDAIGVRDVEDALKVEEAAARRWWNDLPSLVSGLARDRGSGRAHVWVRHPDEPTLAQWRILALRFARRALHPLTGSPIADALDRMHEAVYATASAETRGRVRDLSTLFHVVPSGGAAADRSAVVRTLSDAWVRSRRVRIRVAKTGGETTTNVVEPLGLLLRGDHLLLVARLPDRAGAPRRHYRIDRIETAELLGHAFARPDRRVFDPETHLEHAWGVYLHDDLEPMHVEVILRGPWATMTEHFLLHPTQQNVPLPADDGVPRAQVTWHVAPCPEFLNFLLSTMPHLEHIAPTSVRRQLVERLFDGLDRLHGSAEPH